MDRYMSFHMNFAAENLGYRNRNISLGRFDTYSNWVGGVCVIKLAVFDGESIRKMVTWLPLSNDFLGYIYQQLSGFSRGMATKMFKIVIFTNMEWSENHTG